MAAEAKDLRDELLLLLLAGHGGGQATLLLLDGVEEPEG